MAKVHQKPSCLVNFKGESGSLTCFTETSLEKFLTCHKLWLELDGEQREIANKTTHIVGDIQTNRDSLNVYNLHYHQSCYSKFTNMTFIRRSQSRFAKRKRDHESNNNEDTNKISEVDEAVSVPPKRCLRSSTVTSVAAKSRNHAVLQPICINCNKENKYITNPVRFLCLIRLLSNTCLLNCLLLCLLLLPKTCKNMSNYYIQIKINR